MRICHLTTAHPADDSRIFVKECRTLAGLGYDTHLVALGATPCEKHGVTIHGPAKPGGGRIRRAFAGGWAVYKASRAVNADIYHFHDPELLPMGLLLRWKGKTVVYDAHENNPAVIRVRHWIPKAFRKMASWGFRVVEDAFAKRMNCVIAATPSIRDRFSKCRRVAAVMNYPMLSEFPRAVGRDVSEIKPAVCYIGGMSEERGIREIVEAAHLAGVRLLLAGRWLSPTARESASTLPGWESVEELGVLDRAGVAQTLRRSVAGLVTLYPTPNHIESLPIKLFEYMAAGLPVISSNFPLWRRIVQGHGCGICVEPFDTEAIAKAIRWLIAHPEQAAEMGRNGRKAVENEYSWDEQARTLAAVYVTLTAERRIPSSVREREMSVGRRVSPPVR